MHYLVIEHFRNRDPLPIYRRFRDRGRLMPDGLRYVSSWILDDLSCCYQLMETDKRELLDQWMDQWSDLMAFEVFPVLSSAEVQARLAPQLSSA
jgi:hypothetical protein